MSVAVEIHSYKRSFSSELRGALRKVIKDANIPTSIVDTIDVYDFDNERHEHTSGGGKKFLFFVNTTHKSCSKEKVVIETPINMFGVEAAIELHNVHGKGEILFTDDGYPVAEYFDKEQVLNVLFDLQAFSDADAIKIWTAILRFFQKQVQSRRDNLSWTKAKSRDNIIKAIGASLEASTASRKNELTNKLRDIEDSIRNYKQSLANSIRSQSKFMKELDMYNGGENVALKQYLDDLELIVAHPKVADIYYENGLFELHTNDITITDEDGNTYYGGKFRVTINMQNTEVKFYDGNPHRSFWTDHDPHPHVSGASNGACLGNAASMMAECAAQNQLYAMVLTVISFLESVNTDDSAGKNVYRWEKIDENGNIIENKQHQCAASGCTEVGLYRCDISNDWYCSEDLYNGAISQTGTRINVASELLEEHFTYNDQHEEWVHNGFDGDLDDIL